MYERIKATFPMSIMSSINIKTTEEIKTMRESGEILGNILHELKVMAEPGVTPMDLERKAEELFEKYNVIPAFKGYHGYPAILCIATNEEVVHAIPGNKPFKKGDLISVDCGVEFKGMTTDSAFAKIVGGDEAGSDDVFHLKDACIRALWAGINIVKPGITFGDISYAIGEEVRKSGYKVIEELTGHGVGHNLHEEPIIPNKGRAGSGATLKAGMTFALEPIIVDGSPDIVTLEDGWTIVTRDGSLACQHEHTVLVTEEGHEVLTLRPPSRAKAKNN